MRGLLIKDYRLLWNQRRTLGIMMLIWAIVVFTNTNPAFAVSYLIFSCSILAINTVSYDQHENGIIFLLSLPISRKQYVQEKYLLLLINLMAAVLISVLFIWLPGNIEGIEVMFLIGVVVLGNISDAMRFTDIWCGEGQAGNYSIWCGDLYCWCLE